MSITNLSRESRNGARSGPSYGPRIAFLATMALVGAVYASRLIPSDLLIPAASTLLFVLAAVFALVAWIRCSTDEYEVTYWDVAGALTLVGICTAALIEPDQLVRLVGAANSER